MKKQAVETMHTPGAIIANVAGPSGAAVSMSLPPLGLMKRVILRTREKALGAPANPRSLESLVLPAEEMKTDGGEDFLLADTGPGRNRILIFSTERNMRVLAKSKYLLADGAFDKCPALFEQLYTWHCIYGNSIIIVILHNYKKVFYK